MPFRQSSIMDERIGFVIEAIRGNRAFSSVCRDYGISRPTGYMWLRRYQETGLVSSLAERSRRPRRPRAPGRPRPAQASRRPLVGELGSCSCCWLGKVYL